MLAAVLGLSSAFFFAVAHILVNRGLAGMDYFSGDIASSGHARLGEATLRGWLWFAASGCFHYLAYVFMYLAFNVGDVAIISPLVNGSAIFVPPLAYLLLHDIEKVTARKVIAAALVVGGVFLISWAKL